MTYGHLTTQQLKAHEIEICNMNFHKALLVDTIFNAIDYLIKLAEYALIPMSPNQAFSLVFTKALSYFRILPPGIWSQWTTKIWQNCCPQTYNIHPYSRQWQLHETLQKRPNSTVQTPFTLGSASPGYQQWYIDFALTNLWWWMHCTFQKIRCQNHQT